MREPDLDATNLCSYVIEKVWVLVEGETPPPGAQVSPTNTPGIYLAWTVKEVGDGKAIVPERGLRPPVWRDRGETVED